MAPGRTPQARTRFLTTPRSIIIAAVILSLGGTATAAQLITGKDIKNNSVASKDIKNGSLKLGDFKASQRALLVGPPGASGASAFTPPPSGTTITGTELLSLGVTAAGIQLRDFVPLPITPAAALNETPGPTRNMWFGGPASAAVADTDEDTTQCAGTSAAPNPAPGKLCIYLKQVVNVAANTAIAFSGVFLSGIDETDLDGFTVRVTSNAAGDVDIRYVWAYEAP